MKNLLIIKLIFALINNACIPQDNGEFKKEDALAMINYKLTENFKGFSYSHDPVSYTHLRAHETREDLVCRLLLEKKKK